MSAESGAALGEPPEDAVLMPHAADTVHAASRALTILGMGDMVDELASRVVGRHLKEQLASTTEASDVSVLQPALQYCETVPLQFLDLVLPQGVSSFWGVDARGAVRVDTLPFKPLLHFGCADDSLA